MAAKRFLNDFGSDQDQPKEKRTRTRPFFTSYVLLYVFFTIKACSYKDLNLDILNPSLPFYHLSQVFSLSNCAFLFIANGIKSLTWSCFFTV